jgi:hypothetical protein
MKTSVRSRTPLARLTCLVLADAAVLMTLHPPTSALLGHLASPDRWVREVGADGAAVQLAGAALWCAALWCAAGLFATLLGAVPGSVGVLSDHLARALVPRAVHRLVAAAIGLGVMTAPVVASAAGAGGLSGAATSTSGPSIPAPSWPTSLALPVPAWPTSGAAQVKPPPTTPMTTTPTPPTPRAHAVPAAPAAVASVVVRPGDSLWLIAAARLRPRTGDAAIAAACRQWYAANRAAIGADPDLIRPGLMLRAPDTTVLP